MYFVKDLSKLGRDMKDVIIVDNSPSAYMFQKSNAIPIISWFQNKADRELYKLASFLTKIATVEDVRTQNLQSWRKKLTINPVASPRTTANRKEPVTPQTMKSSKSSRILFRDSPKSSVS